MGCRRCCSACRNLGAIGKVLGCRGYGWLGLSAKREISERDNESKSTMRFQISGSDAEYAFDRKMFVSKEDYPCAIIVTDYSGCS
jgi:hypothetical protein